MCCRPGTIERIQRRGKLSIWLEIVETLLVKTRSVGQHVAHAHGWADFLKKKSGDYKFKKHLQDGVLAKRVDEVRM